MFMAKKRAKFVLSGAFAGLIGVLAAFGQSDQRPAASGSEQLAQPLRETSAPAPAPPSNSRPFLSSRTSKSADEFYKSVWGIEKMVVRQAASGALLRFSFRVSDAERARELNDKKLTAYLIDQKTGAILQIPNMPKVGMLRQTATPVNGVEYWMLFSNKGNFVKSGNRVDVVIGNFRAQGLVVQ
jgi:hypothetical protein